MSGADEARRLEFAGLAAARERMYAFLSGVFGSPPSCSQLEALHEEAFWTDARRVVAETVLAPLRAWIGGAAAADEVQRDVRREFLELFKIPGRKYVAPYESVYGDVREVAGERFRGLLMGPSATDVRRWYRLVEAGGGDENDDLPDHIRLELGFLGRLCGEEQALTPQVEMSRLERVWEIERDFLTAHVVRWVRALRDTIYARSQHSYYRSAADMAVEFTTEDSRRLEELVGPARVRKCSTGNAHEG